jgi:hypothetical protein
MLLLSQIREELATYFELLQQPKTAAEKVIRDRIVNLHNELVQIETQAAVVPVADLITVLSTCPKTPASFKATVDAVEALVAARKAAAPPVPVEVPEVVPEVVQ